MSIESTVVATRLNKDQKKKFEILAQEKGMTTAMLFKHIIVDYIEERKANFENSNLMHMQILNLKESVDKFTVNQEWFEQVFFNWLTNWFMAHPKVEDEKKAVIIAKEGKFRRDEFIKAFNKNFYNENETLYETLFMNSAEEKEE